MEQDARLLGTLYDVLFDEFVAEYLPVGETTDIVEKTRRVLAAIDRAGFEIVRKRTGS